MNGKELLASIKSVIEPAINANVANVEDTPETKFLISQLRRANEMIVTSVAYKILDIIDVHIKQENNVID